MLEIVSVSTIVLASCIVSSNVSGETDISGAMRIDDKTGKEISPVSGSFVEKDSVVAKAPSFSASKYIVRESLDECVIDKEDGVTVS